MAAENCYSTIDQDYVKRMLDDPEYRDKLTVMAFTHLLQSGEMPLGSIGMEELHHLRNMIAWKPVMKQLGMEKSYWELTEDDIEAISIQEARNKGYDA